MFSCYRTLSFAKERDIYYGIKDINNVDYYKEYIYEYYDLRDRESIGEFFNGNKDRLFTIGCVAKSITAAGIMLFSQDSANQYLFLNKNLEITIGELINNRKKYLENLDNLTEIQSDKLKLIDKLITFIDNRILETQVYKILNHTSVFADDYNRYWLYFLFQQFIKNFPEDIKKEIFLFGIQFISLTSPSDVDVRFRYSNMGYMYISMIMGLLTDEKDFYAEVEKRIFYPLGLEKNFTRVDYLTTKQLKQLFPNHNYIDIKTYANGEKIFRKLDIYKYFFTEMDTLNGGLISTIESANIVGEEIAKMYFNIDNKLTKNSEEISKLFFKYKKVGVESGEFYSTGITITFNYNYIELLMSGDVFGAKTKFFFSLDSKNTTPNLDYDFNIKNYNKNIDRKIIISIKNLFIYNLFFSYNVDFEKKPFNEILLKSIFDSYNLKGILLDTDSIEFDLNNNRGKLIENISKNYINNLNYFIDDIEERNKLIELLEFFIYSLNTKNKN